MSARVDLNSDVGESFGRWTLGDDEEVIEIPMRSDGPDREDGAR